MNIELLEIINILELNKIKYKFGNYAGYKSIVIKSSKYKLEIYYNKGLTSDFQKVPYTWGRMGDTDIERIIRDLEILKEKKLIYQIDLFGCYYEN